MNKKICILITLTLLFVPAVSAQDIVFYVDQTEYYFLLNQEAVVPLTINNSYDKEIDGTISYTIVQEVNQGSSTYSSTRSQSQSFSTQKGNHTIGINFGTSGSPITLRVSMQFSYTEGDDRAVSLDDITIYFVSNQSQMNNQQNPKQSSSEKVTNGQQTNQNNQQNQQEQTPQQQLQNSQLNQDSSALKEQIQKQLQQEQAIQEQFEQELFNNSKFQQKQQDLLDQGYQMKEKQLDAKTNNSGNFNITYENKQGETASVKGNMENGNITDMQTQTAEDRENMLDQLEQNEQFQQFEEQLEQEGFNKTSIEFSQSGNRTDVQVKYQNSKNETASIHAEFYDTDLQSVCIEKQDQMNLVFLIIPIVIILFSLLLLYFLKIKNVKDTIPTIQPINKTFDYKKHAEHLLKEAEELFKQKKYKDAYGKAGQALRLYLSYYHGLNKEITNDEIIKYLRNKKQTYDDIRSFFNLCNLVEFAKYKANEHDFHRIITTAKNIITP
jgi:hypothetical protein